MPPDKIDRLFLLYGSPESARVRVVLSHESATDEGFVGSAGQKLFVFVALDPDAGADLLEHYGLQGEAFPVMVTHTGEVHRSVKQILLHLQDNKMAT